MQTLTTTHETFIHGVRDIVLDHAVEVGAIATEEAEKLKHARLVYGIGTGRERGRTVYGVWRNGQPEACDLVEVAASAEEGWVQVAGTTIHELGHVLAGWGAGHKHEWKEACKRLGFRIKPKAAGQRYTLAMMEPSIRLKVAELANRLADGRPEFLLHAAGGQAPAKRPTSKGACGTTKTKQGTRMLKVECPETGYKARMTRKWLEEYGAPLCPCHNETMVAG